MRNKTNYHFKKAFFDKKKSKSRNIEARAKFRGILTNLGHAMANLGQHGRKDLRLANLGQLWTSWDASRQITGNDQHGTVDNFGWHIYMYVFPYLTLG